MLNEPIHTLSPLSKTWILDLDGTLVKHNGYKSDGTDTFLDGARDFLNSIPETDFILFLTSRTEDCRQQTIDFLRLHGIRYDQIVFNAPYGERILINDRKPSGLQMAYAINPDRDIFMPDRFKIDSSL